MSITAEVKTDFSIEVYNRRAQKVAEELGGLEIHSIHDWYQEKGFIQYWSDQISKILLELNKEELESTVVICSAHSLPEKILEYSDPYPDQCTFRICFRSFRGAL
ncbi:ferrochelatase [Halalkalibacter alkalisediminis]|uniref:Ferrochelatase n=1 Tax=Halalkalibacter alkalisediminis TaxID=935616 RepID=A0ABV6NNV2_9BACI|nr:ferrochelatase [Halalkalibacter alkalisediminis]